MRGIWYGTEGDYHALAMNLLGPNLFQLMSFCGGHFSLKTVLMLGEQMVCSFVQFTRYLSVISLLFCGCRYGGCKCSMNMD